MTETPKEDKGYTGDDAADLGRPADERDVQTAPGGDVEAQNVKQADDEQRSETEQQ